MLKKNYLLLELELDLKSKPNNHVKSTAFHQASLAATKPPATKPGNTKGTTWGQIQNTNVPANTATTNSKTNPPRAKDNTVIKFFII
jgi:hypothetical protein